MPVFCPGQKQEIHARLSLSGSPAYVLRIQANGISSCRITWRATEKSSALHHARRLFCLTRPETSGGFGFVRNMNLIFFTYFKKT
jgi:hypothetical protein